MKESRTSSALETSTVEKKAPERTGVSRQRRYQIRMERAGRCRICGAPAVTKVFCEKHRQSANVRVRELARKYTGAKRRRLGAESYSFKLPKTKPRSLNKAVTHANAPEPPQ